jgi:hypothetical protein
MRGARVDICISAAQRGSARRARLHGELYIIIIIIFQYQKVDFFFFFNSQGQDLLPLTRGGEVTVFSTFM